MKVRVLPLELLLGQGPGELGDAPGNTFLGGDAGVRDGWRGEFRLDLQDFSLRGSYPVCVGVLWYLWRGVVGLTAPFPPEEIKLSIYRV